MRNNNHTGYTQQHSNEQALENTASLCAIGTTHTAAGGRKRAIRLPMMLVGALGFCLLSATASAGEQSRSERHRPGNQAISYTEYADVIDVRPIYRQIRVERPVRECWTDNQRHQTVYEGYDNERQNNHQNNRKGNPLIGGLLGGAIGNQLGRHSGSDQGRIGATIAGAVIGSSDRQHDIYTRSTRPAQPS